MALKLLEAWSPMKALEAPGGPWTAWQRLETPPLQTLIYTMAYNIYTMSYLWVSRFGYTQLGFAVDYNKSTFARYGEC